MQELKCLKDLKKESEAKKVFPLSSETEVPIMEEEEFQSLKHLTKVYKKFKIKKVNINRFFSSLAQSRISQ